MSKAAYSNEYLKEFVESNSECKFRGTYFKETKYGRKRMLQLTCPCGNDYDFMWVRFKKSKKTCKSCSIANRGKAYRMTNDEYVDIKKERGITIEHLEEIHGANIPTLHKCPVCGDENWKPLPSNVITGQSTKCSRCSGKIAGDASRSNDVEYQKKKKNLGIDVINVEPYLNSHTKIKHVCPRCGEDWHISPNAILARKLMMCEPCGYKERGKAALSPKDHILNIVKEGGCEWIGGEYETSRSKLTFRCSCGELFERAFSDYRSGWNRCKSCSGSVSSGENAIMKWLVEKGVNFTHQQKFSDLLGERKMPLSFDFGILDKDGGVKCLIEYDGIHHFKPVDYGVLTEDEALKEFEKRKMRDERKNEYAKNKGLRLIRLNGKQYEKLDEYLKDIL